MTEEFVTGTTEELSYDDIRTGDFIKHSSNEEGTVFVDITTGSVNSLFNFYIHFKTAYLHDVFAYNTAKELISKYRELEKKYALTVDDTADTYIFDKLVNQAESKYYISIVRDKANLKTAKFEIVKIKTTSKKKAEDLLFYCNLAPFGNKIYSEEQFKEVSEEYLKGKGIELVEQMLECARVLW